MAYGNVAFVENLTEWMNRPTMLWIQTAFWKTALSGFMLLVLLTTCQHMPLAATPKNGELETLPLLTPTSPHTAKPPLNTPSLQAGHPPQKIPPQKMLSGSVEESVVVEMPKVFPPGVIGGIVRDEATGKPIAGAHVQIPQLERDTVTDSLGRFTLDRLPEGTFILSVQKNGLFPQNGILEVDQYPTVRIDIALHALEMASAVDMNWHHIGDGNYSWASAGATEFNRASEGYHYQKTFSIAPALRQQIQSGGPMKLFLHVGAVLGLDTPDAQRAGQSQINVVSSNPKLWINGTELAGFRLNGLNQQFRVPPGILNLNGTNKIVIEAGYHFPRGTIDYDDFEWMTLLLVPQR